MIKKLTASLLILIIAVTGLCACGDTQGKTDRLQIVCTVFPYYDWVRNLTEGVEDADITLLLDSGTDLHSYQPAAKDIVTISSADLFIYTDGTSDKWVTDVLSSSQNDSTVILPLMTNLPEESLFCVEAIGEEEHHHEEGEEHSHAHDEHIWLSLKNAMKLCENIKNVLCDIDSENAEIYKANFIKYHSELQKLDEAYSRTLSSCQKNTVVFADRFPFIYLINDYGLSYHAAFSGCSAESEASFETVKRLADEIDTLGLTHILITETSDGSVAKTVKDSTKEKNQEILVLNALQSVTKENLADSYIEVMTENLAILKEALS
ncbi:MAG: zinc ABC transporter substrate-binding protein [Clostridia bacterium]|nr:zinc ABC transporter substrate-binding protein [Clostridia bacterium]